MIVTDLQFQAPCVAQQRQGIGRRDFLGRKASYYHASIGKALMPKSDKPNNTIETAAENMPSFVRVRPKPQNDVELVKLRAKPANRKQSRETVFPSDGSWTEWKLLRLARYY